MKNISRKLLLSSLTVVLTVIALGTTTFAWFTITNTAKVQSFETQITADEGIEIAIGIITPTLSDAEQTKYEVNSPANLNWVTTLSTSDIEEFIDLHISEVFRFDHLTSPDGKTFYTFSQDAVGGSVGLNEGYLELPIHFRSANVNSIHWKSITLSDDNPNWISDVDAFTNYSGTIVNRGDSITVNPTDALRISIDSGDTLVAYEKPASTTNHYLGTGGDLTAIIDPDAEVPDDEYKISERGAHSYYFAKTNLLPDGIELVTTVGTISDLLVNNSVDGEQVLALTSGQLATAGMDNYGEVNINIWIEGWDANAFNSILDEYIRITFEFKGATV